MQFEVVREVGGNFYLNVVEAVGEVFGFDSTEQERTEPEPPQEETP